MKLLFAHDHRFYTEPSGSVLTTGSLPSAIWERYLRQFSRLKVLGRNGGATPAAAFLTRSDHPLVDFTFPAGNATGLDLIRPRRKVREAILAEVAAADAIIARVPSELGLQVVAAARRLLKPYALELDGCAWDCLWNYGSHAARLYAPLSYLRVRREVSAARLVIYVTRSWLQKRYPTKGVTAGASNVSLIRLDEQPRIRREARLRALRRGHPPKVGTAAHLNGKYKGLETSLRAISALHKVGLELRYEIVGFGDADHWKDLAQRLGIAKNVCFLGPLPSQEMPNWYDQLDVYLQPSFHEGLPRSTIEAMSRGVACIGSSCGGIPELLPADRLHPPGDWETLKEIIATLVREPSLIAIAAHFDLETSASFLPSVIEHERDGILELLRRDACSIARRGNLLP